ncbi:hypothetical protein FRACYDRAFT_247922 [Fragilariopsis cylindrus CCMP1102]|uniref:Uncharacterized protein n=1 Tax=Fragilariopsis cylindrus CCMP1102 TaxID=635003 RepID=A0A1E7EUX9_9STRA|nr:hypothetical protein FRACYDRAFT_247922 [Fragilariopsis cylindrus CCMP1102]|eukprot:OEU09666.1 hypothetical protein FRACYDRAFT_247922 [Fragilariopsis cylindrus CCMP1102]
MHAFHDHFIRHPDADCERDSENENDDFIKSQSLNERSKNTNYIVHFRQPSFTQEPPLLLSAIDEDHEIFFKLVDNDNNHDHQKDCYEYDGCDNNQNRISNRKFNVIYPIMIYFITILTIVLSATIANQKGIESIPIVEPISVPIPIPIAVVQEELSPTTTTSTTDPHRRQQQQQQHQEQQQQQNHDFNFDNNNAFLIPPTTMMTATMTAKMIDKRTIQQNNNNDNNFDRNKRIGNNDDEDSNNEAENDKKNNEQIIADVTRKFLREHSPPSFEM